MFLLIDYEKDSNETILERTLDVVVYKHLIWTTAQLGQEILTQQLIQPITRSNQHLTNQIWELIELQLILELCVHL